ncbi:hypothetical protein P171DRAFT_474250 [Karstenula rhodostoma CBS 690.94]|uniref:Uncharacterized protein n=1 Tax=Karstenula rhodostoma CBS 690.94 TaxID=1392251 RepID=A0A9P4PH88_9PLEO|nr:hypothetical protein P171DRAFT_474250 [Karstenula rhodostoma CBS 690.94]
MSRVPYPIPRLTHCSVLLGAAGCCWVLLDASDRLPQQARWLREGPTMRRAPASSQQRTQIAAVACRLAGLFIPASETRAVPAICQPHCTCAGDGLQGFRSACSCAVPATRRVTSAMPRFSTASASQRERRSPTSVTHPGNDAAQHSAKGPPPPAAIATADAISHRTSSASSACALCTVQLPLREGCMEDGFKTEASAAAGQCRQLHLVLYARLSLLVQKPSRSMVWHRHRPVERRGPQSSIPPVADSRRCRIRRGRCVELPPVSGNPSQVISRPRPTAHSTPYTPRDATVQPGPLGFVLRCTTLREKDPRHHRTNPTRVRRRATREGKNLPLTTNLTIAAIVNSKTNQLGLAFLSESSACPFLLSSPCRMPSAALRQWLTAGADGARGQLHVTIFKPSTCFRTDSQRLLCKFAVRLSSSPTHRLPRLTAEPQKEASASARVMSCIKLAA